MSAKMSRKSVLIAELAKDEKIKDAFKLFAQRIVNDSQLSSISLDNYIESDIDDEDLTDADDDQIDGDAEDEYEEDETDLCSDCQCAKQMVINEDNSREQNRNNTNNKSAKKNEIIVGLNGQEMVANEEQNCECADCQQFDSRTKKSDEMANRLIAEEERKKRKSEKKKLQKKKKRDKRKAEKQTNETNGTERTDSSSVQKAVDNSVNTNAIKMTNNSKKAETTVKTNNNNKQKTEPKATAKQKNSNNSDKSTENKVFKQKQNIENKSKAKNSNNKESDRMVSNKASPKSDRENDVQVSGKEEEELLLSSAYVTQIAQRKSKPIYQKPAQTAPEAQDYGHNYSEEYSLKNNANTSDDNSNYSFSNSNTKSNNNSQNNNNLNNNNSNNYNNKAINSSRDVTEESLKYKQYFFEQQKQKSAKGTADKLSKELKQQNIEKSIELAILANQRAESNKFAEAIDLFSQALSFNPNDYRFYVNRSYCYDSIQDYRSALKDAETAIQLKPDWPKCHYRRGKALAGLKNYQESEIALKKVLTLEKDCDEALSELWHVRYGAIVDMGYDTTTANTYSSQFESIKDALEALSLRQEKNKSFNSNNSFKKSMNSSNFNTKNNFNNNAKNGEIWADDDIYISDDEYNSAVREPTYEETSPTNPFGWKALWIGNVALNAKLDTVTAMLRKFGNLNYCNIFKGNNGGNFILVHYDNPESPRLAMTRYQDKVIQGISIPDTGLTIRFRPNKDQKKPNYDQRLESDECYYWRTTGCARGEKCLYKHIQSNRGVDKQAWMCNPLKKGLQPFHKTQK